ncbi:MAG: thermonuclease family protein [Hyphomicrobiaceae bacterium]|nr:thermonuclease family protein [Hyphomicrobiaceae bacterium]
MTRWPGGGVRGALLGLASLCSIVATSYASEAGGGAPPIGSMQSDHVNSACEAPVAPRSRIVATAIDGETLRLEDGDEVRLVGALAPRSPTPDAETAWPIDKAARDSLAALTSGRAVKLAYPGHQRDRYGRHLAQVFVTPEGGGAAIWVQRAMIEAGHARAYGIPGNFACVEGLVAAEGIAREAKTGLWAIEAFRPREARRAGELVALRSTFQLVEGNVVRARRSGASIYLDYGRNWRSDFSVAVLPPTARENPAWAASLLGLEGRRTRVRGWITLRNGPMIEIEHPSQLELLD